jgi:hypothetical protein
MFNRADFGYPNAMVGNPYIGQLTSASDGRDMQFGLKLSF